jgi:hypothetical protein
MRKAAAWIVGLLAACSAQPARFADRAPVTAVHDDAAVPLPRKRMFLRELYMADVHVRREVTKNLDPRRPPDALDASSIDEVPPSSWYRGAPYPKNPLRGYRRDGPPEPPFTMSADAPVSGTRGAMAMVDARGLAYEIVPDVRGRGGMRSSADAIASRLVYMLGYRTAEVYVIPWDDGTVVGAVRWPVGIDLGPTPIGAQRDDDPNDHLPHIERRTLRAFGSLAAWLGITRLDPAMLRDVYVGEPDQGHVEHWIVGLDGALGVDAYFAALAWARNEDREETSFFLRLFSLGLSPKPAAFEPAPPFASVGLLDEHLVPEFHQIGPPFEPFDRLQPADTYWMAKRIAALPLGAIGEAIIAGGLEPAAQHWLYQVLELRRAAVIAWAFDLVTPCDPVAVEPNALVLGDLALATSVSPAAERDYVVRYLGDDGGAVADEIVLRPERGQPIVRVPLPDALGSADYVVVEVLARRAERALPRPMQVHLLPRSGVFRLVGVRH